VAMSPAARKFVLVAHVTSSVGFLGAVVAFLALAVVGLTGDDARSVQAAYVTMAMVTWYVIVPLNVAALLTGLIQSLGTAWGPFRHYWTGRTLVHELECSRTARVGGPEVKEPEAGLVDHLGNGAVQMASPSNGFPDGIEPVLPARDVRLRRAPVLHE
jgi:hypothetical protein